MIYIQFLMIFRNVRPSIVVYLWWTFHGMVSSIYVDDFNIFQWELSEHIFSESLFLEGFYLGIWATGLGLNLKRLLDFSGNDPLLDLHKRLPNREGKNPLKLASGRLALVSKSLQFLGSYIDVIYDIYII